MPQDLVNEDIIISSNAGILMKSINGVIKSFPINEEPEWIAINIGGINYFFEDVTTPKILKDNLDQVN